MTNRWLVTLSVFMLSGCASTLQDAASGISDPTERGLMYVAISIIIAAILRIFL